MGKKIITITPKIGFNKQRVYIFSYMCTVSSCTNKEFGYSLHNFTNLVNVLIHCVWHVKINHQFDVDQVKSSTQDPCTDDYFKLSIQKTLKKQSKYIYMNCTLISHCYTCACLIKGYLLDFKANPHSPRH